MTQSKSAEEPMTGSDLADFIDEDSESFETADADLWDLDDDSDRVLHQVLSESVESYKNHAAHLIPDTSGNAQDDLSTDMTLRIVNDIAIARALADVDEAPRDNTAHEATQPARSTVSAQSGQTSVQPGRNVPQNVQNIHAATSNELDPEPDAEPPSQSAIHSELESSYEIRLRLANEFSPIVQPGWDTLIYIGPPAQEYGQDDAEYEYIKRHFAKPYLMCSEILKATKSAEFVKLLGPMSARAQRRLKKLNLHLNLPGGQQPKYYIDLRPPQDDDEAVLMITEMSCPDDLLLWHQKAQKLGVDQMVVCGTDNLNGTLRRLGEPTSRSLTANHDPQPAYSPLRHHLAIERLLHAICEGDPKLDSAPKVWSFVAIAKHLDCIQHPRVATEVYSWLFANRNSNFIQHNPEATYRIAVALQFQDITRVSYALLVSRKSLLISDDQSVARIHGTSPKLKRGYSSCHLDDDEINRIDHGAHTFSNHVRKVFMKIANEPMSWMVGSTEVLKLLALRATDNVDREVLIAAWQILRKYVRSQVYRALCQNLQVQLYWRRVGKKDSTNDQGLALSSFIANEYNDLSLSQRLLTNVFWEHLRVYGFRQEVENLDAWLVGHSLLGIDGLAADFEEMAPTDPDLCISKEDVRGALTRVNTMIHYSTATYVDLPRDPVALANFRLTRTLIQIAAHQNVKAGFWGLTTDNGQANTDLVDTPTELIRAMQELRISQASEFPGLTPHMQREFVQLLGETPSRYRWDDFTRERKSHAFKINHDALISELGIELSLTIRTQILTPGWADDEIGVENEIPICDTLNVLCVGSKEWRYLPLWAGGFDDGSGGVFNEAEVPNMLVEEGFKGGKRGLNEGLHDLDDIEMGEAGYSVVGDSDFEELATDDGVSTVGKASRIATNGTRTTAATVMSLDE